MTELRVVLNQCGAALELHKEDKSVIVVDLYRPEHIEAYGRKVAADNPDMRYASIGQMALAMAREIAKGTYPVNPNVWTYNASTNEYSIA